MGDATKIEWTHHTFNPWIGCTKVSPGCKHCYAEALTRRSPALVHGQSGAAVVGLPVWGDAAPRRVTSAANWRQPLRWNAAAKKAGERRRVFCASLADVFEEREGLESARARLWALIEQTPHLDWLLLTKRPMWVLPSVPWRWWRTNPGTGGTLLRRRDNYCVFCDKLGVHTEDRGEGEVHHRCATRVYGWPRNVWIGCTVEDQRRAEERLPHLLKIPAPVRFVSYEPALAAVDFRPWLPRWVETPEGPSRRRHDGGPMGEGGCIDWLKVVQALSCVASSFSWVLSSAKCWL